jgi:hypothetical protein
MIIPYCIRSAALPACMHKKNFRLWTFQTLFIPKRLPIVSLNSCLAFICDGKEKKIRVAITKTLDLKLQTLLYSTILFYIQHNPP